MPKLKTKKCVSKRVVITKKRKLKITAAGQNHFNGRETGNVRRNKRRLISLSGVNADNVKKLMPYS